MNDLKFGRDPKTTPKGEGEKGNGGDIFSTTGLRSIKFPEGSLVSRGVATQVEEALEIIHGAETQEGAKPGIIELDRIVCSLKTEKTEIKEKLGQEKKSLEGEINILIQDRNILAQKVTDLEFFANKWKIVSRGVVAGVMSLIVIGGGKTSWDIGDWIFKTDAEQAERLQAREFIMNQVRTTLMRLGAVPDLDFKMEKIVLERVDSKTSFNDLSFLDKNNDYAFQGNYNGEQFYIRIPFGNPKDIELEFASKNIFLLEPSVQDIISQLQVQSKLQDDTEKEQSISPEDKEKQEKIQKNKDVILTIARRLSGDVTLSSYETSFEKQLGELKVKFIPIRGNGGIKNDEQWYNDYTFSSYVFTYLIESSSANDITVAITLEDPFNVTIILKQGNNQTNVLPDYSSTNLDVFFRDLEICITQ